MISSNQVKFLASSLGFDACGIVRIDGSILEEDMRPFRTWIAQGFHGTMKYLEDFESRAKKFWENFPEAKSLIVVGVNYYSGHGDAAKGRNGKISASPFPRVAVSENQGRVARYAWGKDYHRVIGKRLEELRNELSKLAGRQIRAEICVDTKPLLERSLAQRAGLGFVGKQSQLLSPKFGPWLFLAELVTDLELEPDPPFVGSCGSCRICIDECPTQAIHPEGGIDARRCIAYLTIEHKGEISENLHSAIGDWVFGCDICLQVCPYASKGKETAWEELKSPAGKGTSLDLLKLFKIPSNGSYEKEFGETAISRANRKQLLRNATIVLQNKGGKS